MDLLQRLTIYNRFRDRLISEQNPANDARAEVDELSDRYSAICGLCHINVGQLMLLGHMWTMSH